VLGERDKPLLAFLQELCSHQYFAGLSTAGTCRHLQKLELRHDCCQKRVAGVGEVSTGHRGRKTSEKRPKYPPEGLCVGQQVVRETLGIAADLRVSEQDLSGSACLRYVKAVPSSAWSQTVSVPLQRSSN
jgi:hypothetical protein